MDEVSFDRVSGDARFNTYGVPRNSTKSAKKASDKKETVPNAMLKNVETMEYICQLWEEVKTSDLEVDFYHAGQLYGRILFTNGSVSFEAHTGNGWKTSDDPEKLINYSKWFKDRRRDVDIFDDMELIKDLGRMIKK